MSLKAHLTEKFCSLDLENTNKMTSIVPFKFDNVQLFNVNIDEKVWVRAKEVVRSALKYNRDTVHVIKDHCSPENYAQKWQLMKSSADDLLNWPKDSRKDDYYINEEGIKELVLKSKQFNANEIAKQFGIEIHKHKYTSKEQDTIGCIMKVFNGEEMKY